MIHALVGAACLPGGSQAGRSGRLAAAASMPAAAAAAAAWSGVLPRLPTRPPSRGPASTLPCRRRRRLRLGRRRRRTCGRPSGSEWRLAASHRLHQRGGEATPLGGCTSSRPPPAPAPRPPRCKLRLCLPSLLLQLLIASPSLTLHPPRPLSLHAEPRRSWKRSWRSTPRAARRWAPTATSGGTGRGWRATAPWCGWRMQRWAEAGSGGGRRGGRCCCCVSFYWCGGHLRFGMPSCEAAWGMHVQRCPVLSSGPPAAEQASSFVRRAGGAPTPLWPSWTACWPASTGAACASWRWPRWVQRSAFVWRHTPRKACLPQFPARGQQAHGATARSSAPASLHATGRIRRSTACRLISSTGP